MVRNIVVLLVGALVLGFLSTRSAQAVGVGRDAFPLAIAATVVLGAFVNALLERRTRAAGRRGPGAR